jgi:hypothetical protein
MVPLFEETDVAPSADGGNDDGTGVSSVPATRTGAGSVGRVCIHTPPSQRVALWNAASICARSFMRD